MFHPGCDDWAEQKLIHCGNLSKEVLLIGHVHSGISTQHREAVNGLKFFNASGLRV
jgi:hypothetical protein